MSKRLKTRASRPVYVMPKPADPRRFRESFRAQAEP
jgi:hypothetical protein